MFEQQIQFIKDKLENILKIGNVSKVNGSDGSLQEIQAKTLRNIEDAMKVGQFGFNSKAPKDSRCIVAKIGNENIVIANEHIASIIDVASGDTVVYNENGDYVKIEENLITVKASELIVDSANSTFTGNVSVDGDLDAASVTDSTLDVNLGTHVHTGNLGNPTSAPTPGT